MKKIVPIVLAAIAIIGVGLYLAVDKNEVRVIPEERVTSDSKTQLTSKWRMSSGHVIVKVPTGWGIEQMDAGGKSMIIVKKENSDTAVYIQLSQPWEEIAFAEWLEQGHYSDPIRERNFHGVKLSLYSRETDFPGPESRTYFGQIGDNTFIEISEETDDETLEIIESVIINPTDEQLSEAQIIP
ncbi:hypothetical protein ACFLZY_02355 [Patescibacteria group bacterium]